MPGASTKGDGGVRSTPLLGPRCGNVSGFRGQEVIFLRKVGTSIVIAQRANPADRTRLYYCVVISSSVNMLQGGSPQRSKGLKRQGPAFIDASRKYFSVSQLHRSDPCEGLALRYEKAPGTWP